MNTPVPKVSVTMLAYNVEKYIEAAIEGVLNQQVDFPIELIIAEDCSKDNTRKVCDSYASRFPDKVTVLPSDVNRGITGNTARVFAECKGEYIAVCDSDDIWIDHAKLSKQVALLDANPQCGAVYTDVEIIMDDGGVPEDDQYESVRKKYRSGKIFSELLKDNFINNSTSVFRRRFLNGYLIDTDRKYTIYDYLLWLHIASQSEIWFMNEKTTQYRRREGNASSSDEKLPNNRKKTLERIPEVLLQFEKCRPWNPSPGEKIVMFRKLLSVLYRNEADLKTKWRVLGLAPYYFPGITHLIDIFASKTQKRNSKSGGKDSRQHSKLNSQY
jgi:glycosyltransferase involved in cell wall biosynthesis